jgi:hypothetical protein
LEDAIEAGKRADAEAKDGGEMQEGAENIFGDDEEDDIVF